MVPIEGVLWLQLSLLCWSSNYSSISAGVTTFHLLAQIYLDIMQTVTRSHPGQDRHHHGVDVWRISTLTISGVNSGCDYEGKYMSITLLPILLESMIILSKLQYKENEKINRVSHAGSLESYNRMASYLQNTSVVISIILTVLWNMDLRYRNSSIFWTQRSLLLWSVVVALLVVLLAASFVDSLQTIVGEMWFCYFWMTIMFLAGPFRFLSLQGVMTYGEWLVISCCIALVGTSIWTTLLKDAKHLVTFHDAYNDRHDSQHLINGNNDFTAIYAYTATAGVFGCIIACCTVNPLIPFTRTNDTIQKKYRSLVGICHSSIVTNAIRIMYISFMTLTVVECTFWYCKLATRHPFPKCLWWIFNDFLFEIEYTPGDNDTTSLDTGVARWFPPVRRLPRVAWLIYWFATMLVTIPLAPTTGQISPVIARKWFHFIAVLLFVPTTILVPQLQSLSYAVAICVLLIIEVIRIDIPIVNDFYYTYLDQTKDEADDSKFVISHIALVAGCAAPLWIIQYYHSSIFQETIPVDASATMSLNVLVGLWGVWVLGIGDAMGAIIGKSFGRHKWGSNSRTIEGSMAMWFSLVISSFVTTLIAMPVHSEVEVIPSVMLLLPAVFFVTLIEAYTLQIDNIVLPLAGTAMILVCQRKVTDGGMLM